MLLLSLLLSQFPSHVAAGRACCWASRAGGRDGRFNSRRVEAPVIAIGYSGHGSNANPGVCAHVSLLRACPMRPVVAAGPGETVVVVSWEEHRLSHHQDIPGWHVPCRGCCVLRRYLVRRVINHIHSSGLPQYNLSVGPVRVRGVALALAATLFTVQLDVTVTGSAAPLWSTRAAVALPWDHHCSRCRLHVTTFLVM